MSELSKRIDGYLELCRGRLSPLLDRRPWTEMAANPAPEFRAVFQQAERSREFVLVVEAFGTLVCNVVGEPHSRQGASHFWQVSAFFWNSGAYDTLICGQPLDGQRIETSMRQELASAGATHTDAAFLESFHSECSIDAGGFSIRPLADQEIHEIFLGRCRLDQRELERIIRDALADHWFAVVQKPAQPLKDLLFLKGAIGLHDFAGNPFRNVNLALNLYKTTPGPVVIRKTFHWNSSLFHRQVEDCPQQSGDLFPSSWGGTDDPPAMRLYHLDSSDAQALPIFWQELESLFVEQAGFMPRYLHRAIHRFLMACAWHRSDWEFRQLLYMMSLDALFGGEDNALPTSRGKPLSSKLAIIRCCPNLVAPDGRTSSTINDWLAEVYKQRSEVAHGSAFEQEQFFAQSLCPEDHEVAASLCQGLQVDTAAIVEGPDMEFAVLHNLVRLSLLRFMARASSFNWQSEARQIVRAILEPSEEGKAAIERRRSLLSQLERMHLEDKKEFLQRVHDSFRDESVRRQLRESVGALAKYSR